MAETRFNSDPCRISKKLQQMTDQGRYILNMPGNGEHPAYMADPQIIIQKWGANLRTNSINLESELLGVNRPLSKDCLGKDEYQRFDFKSRAIQYPVCSNLTTEQSRTIMPAWTARDLEQVDWYYPPLNPQENTCMPFQNNLNTRLLERDYFVAKVPCNLSNDYTPLPTNIVRGGYVGGPNTCAQTASCSKM
jgi:hypothetical protein|uniref:Uncharacterized protein n=1 Tax=viral metagenome TaxID=1070528 RepID=A0A6C0HD68_9ZZZZ